MRASSFVKRKNWSSSSWASRTGRRAAASSIWWDVNGIVVLLLEKERGEEGRRRWLIEWDGVLFLVSR